MDHVTGTGCSKMLVPEQTCYVGFVEPQPPLGGLVLQRTPLETVRGEMVLFLLDKEGKIVGFELIAPGKKACQPLWGHGGATEEG